MNWSEDNVRPVSYTHLDVYKRQELTDSNSIIFNNYSIEELTPFITAYIQQNSTLILNRLSSIEDVYKRQKKKCTSRIIIKAQANLKA